MRKMFTMALLVAFVGLSTDVWLAHAQKTERVIRMVGTAVGEMREIDTNGNGRPDTMANCFDVTIVDPSTDEFVGIASDCLSDVEVLNEDDPECNSTESLVGCSVRLVDTAFFRYYDGTIVSRGTVTIQPVTDRDSAKAGITHITGSVPPNNNIPYGLESYAQVKGKVRLSGAVDMTDTVSLNTITFDCVFLMSYRK